MTSECKLFSYFLVPVDPECRTRCGDSFPVAMPWNEVTKKSIARAKEDAEEAVQKYSHIAEFKVIELYRKAEEP